MALTAVHANPPADAYLGGLRAVIASISPALLNRDRWGFQTLRDTFSIDETSHLYCGASPDAAASTIHEAGRRIVDSGAPDDFLGGIGYDFGAVPEPYRTELKAFFAWRLTRPQHRSRD